MNKSKRIFPCLVLTVLVLLVSMAGAEGKALDVSIRNERVTTIFNPHQAFVLEGVVESATPMTEITVEVIDSRSMLTVKTVSQKFDANQKVLSYSLSGMGNKLDVRLMGAGEKLLRVRVFSEGRSAVVLERDFYIKGWCNEIANVTSKCTIFAPRGQAKNLTDKEYETVCDLCCPEDRIAIDIPASIQAGALTLNWYSAPSDFKIVMKDVDGSTVTTVEEQNPGEMICFSYDLDPRVKRLEITTTDDNCRGLSELRVMEAGRVSPLVQHWQPIEGKVDLMVISTHQDDELLFFGGTIPYYVGQGKNVAVVYMANCWRTRYAEAMAGLWACGLRNHPIFVGFQDKNLGNYEDSVALWGWNATEKALVELIRRWQPDVIVTHDVNGEYGHPQHCVTSAAVRGAVVAAADPKAYPQSVAEYGTWEVKKLYIHLYAENSIVMNAFDEHLEELGGWSATELATVGYEKHVTQATLGRHTMETDGVTYDNHRYGLCYTTVGNDIIKEDFFENIPAAEN